MQGQINISFKPFLMSEFMTAAKRLQHPSHDPAWKIVKTFIVIMYSTSKMYIFKVIFVYNYLSQGGYVMVVGKTTHHDFTEVQTF